MTIDPTPSAPQARHRGAFGRRLRPVAAVVGLGLIAALVWLAVRGRAPHGLAVVGRAIADLPVELFDPGSVFAHEVVRTIDLTRELPLPGENPPVVLLPGPFAAADFDELTLDLAEMPRGQMVASWEGSAGSDGSDRSAGSDTKAGSGRPILGKLLRQAEHAAVLADGTLRFSFPLADVAEWRGRIERLLVHTGARHRFHIRPLRVELARRVASPEALARALAAPWLVEVGADRRPALLAAAGTPGDLIVPGPGATRLELSLAPSPANRQSVEVRIVAGPGGSATGGREIWRGTLAAGTARWQELHLDLGRRLHAGDRLRVEVDGPAGALVYLADPVFLAPVRRRAPNLVLISIDTLRADHLSLYGYARNTSPGLDAWARDAVVFRRAVVSATTTLPSHTSLFTGLESIRHGVHRNPAPPGLTSLAAHLRSAGWRTMARTGGGYLHPHFGLNRGFERYSFHRAGVDRNGELATGMATVRPWLEELRDEPFFLFLHTYEVHGPYRPRQPWLEELAPGVAPPGLAWQVAESSSAATGYRVTREGRYIYRGEDPNGPELGEASIAETVAIYDSSIRYVDGEIAGLLAELSRLGLAADTVVVVTSDHGESFGEHGEGGHGYLHDNNALVPLIVRAPGAGAGRQETRQVRSVDIVPTVLELLGAPPLPGIDGVSLRPALAGGLVPGLPDFATTYAANTGYGLALRTDDRLELVLDNSVWAPFRGATALFDVGADPAETRDLHAGHPRTSELARRLLASWARVAPGLHLTLEVPGGSAVPVTVTQPELSPLLVRAVAFEGTAAWEEALRLELPGGSKSHLVLEISPGPVGVQVAGENATLAGERGAQTVGGVRFLWQWKLPEGWQATARPADDDLLLGQLRALGYAN